jgi:hypothetical protein
MDLATFEDLDPSLAHPHFNFQPIHRVRMDGLVAAIRFAGQHGFDDRGDHLQKMRTTKPALPHDPQIDLVRFADVQAIDDVAAID